MTLTFPGLTPERQAEQLQNALALTFQLKAHKTNREMDVYVLKRIASVDPKLTPGTSTGESRWGDTGDMKLVSQTVRALASVVERTLKLPAYDETGLGGRFDMELKWDATEPESLVEAVRSQLGLDLVKTRRPLEYLVVDSAVPPPTW